MVEAAVCERVFALSERVFINWQNLRSYQLAELSDNFEAVVNLKRVLIANVCSFNPGGLFVNKCSLPGMNRRACGCSLKR